MGAGRIGRRKGPRDCDTRQQDSIPREEDRRSESPVPSQSHSPSRARIKRQKLRSCVSEKGSLQKRESIISNAEMDFLRCVDFGFRSLIISALRDTKFVRRGNFPFVFESPPRRLMHSLYWTHISRHLMRHCGERLCNSSMKVCLPRHIIKS